MEPAYARVYRELFEHHWWWRAREAIVLRVLRSLRPARHDRRILDVGCGDALFFPRLAEFGDPLGVEIDGELVSPAGPYRDRIHLGPFDESYQPGVRFDLILMFDVLEHLPDPERALAHAARLLAPEGRLVLTVPAFRVLWTAHDDWNRHRTRYTKRSLRHELESAGLAVENWFYCFHWLAAAKLALRVKEALFRRANGPERLPSPFVNACALRLALIEHRILGPLRLPIGSSLVALIRRA